MNLYFVLEGEKTEPKVYPNWIQTILPHFEQVDFASEASKNNFYLFSAGGIPSIYRHVANAIKDINDGLNYQKLIVCLDGEDIGISARIAELKRAIQKYDVALKTPCQLHIIVQEVCIETWFMGNRDIVARNAQDPWLQSQLNTYNIRLKDPEKLESLDARYNTKAQFHFAYLRAVLQEKNLRYSKSNPRIMAKSSYLEALINRINATDHLKSFKVFHNLLSAIKLETT